MLPHFPFPFHPQYGELDCGLTCLKMVSDFFEQPVSLPCLRKLLPAKQDGVSLKDISDVAATIGLRTMGVKVTYDRLADDLPTPCIAYWKQQHFVVVYQVCEEYVWIADPATRGIKVQSKESFKDGWICDKENQSGVLLLFETAPKFQETQYNRRLELTL